MSCKHIWLSGMVSSCIVTDPSQYVSLPELKKLGFPGVKEARSQLYSRTKVCLVVPDTRLTLADGFPGPVRFDMPKRQHNQGPSRITDDVLLPGRRPHDKQLLAQHGRPLCAKRTGRQVSPTKPPIWQFTDVEEALVVLHPEGQDHGAELATTGKHPC